MVDETATVIVINAWGKLVDQSKINIAAGQQSLQLYDMSRQAAGVYIIKLVTKNTTITKKIILQK